MKKAVLVTGVAGSGKSLVCGELQKRGFAAFDIEDIPGLFSTIDKETGQVGTGFDNDDLESVKKRDWIGDKEKLSNLINQNQGTTFYCGTASNLDALLPLFDLIIMLQSRPETIRQRLAQRKSQEFGNTIEVQDWVLSWKDWWEDHMLEQGAIVVNADQSAIDVTSKIIKISETKGSVG